MKINQRSYEVVRILDDARVGSFELRPKLCVHPEGIERELLLQIAMTALQQGKVSWVRPAPRKPVDAIAPPPRRDSAG
jgi:hypothetical protein